MPGRASAALCTGAGEGRGAHDSLAVIYTGMRDNFAPVGVDDFFFLFSVRPWRMCSPFSRQPAVLITFKVIRRSSRGGGCLKSLPWNNARLPPADAAAIPPQVIPFESDGCLDGSACHTPP